MTSPLIRCRQTLELALPAGRRRSSRTGLIECGYGDWEGQPLKKLAKEPLWPVVQQHPARRSSPSGEAMAAMAARAVAAVRAWDARVTAEHGPDAVWLACSHGDVIKAIVADALGLHLDLFQRIVVDPASVTAIRYTPRGRSWCGSTTPAATWPSLVPPPSGRRRPPATDAAVGGGAGGGGGAGPRRRRRRGVRALRPRRTGVGGLRGAPRAG